MAIEMRELGRVELVADHGRKFGLIPLLASFAHLVSVLGRWLNAVSVVEHSHRYASNFILIKFSAS
jgi:hypothetical protein